MTDSRRPACPPRQVRRVSAIAAALIGCLSLAGCGAFSAVSEATAPLDAYTLTPLSGTPGGGGRLHIVVAEPEAGGALATDRILIKPNAYQAQYLPTARWVDATPVLVQGLLVGSLQNRGGFRLVGRDSAGLVPDYTLLTDIHAFEAETVPASASGDPKTEVVIVKPRPFNTRPKGAVPEPTLRARISMTMTLLREEDRALVATRRFTQTARATASGDLALVQAFEVATRAVLAEATGWAVAQTR